MRLAFAGEADAARDRLDSVDPDGLAPTNKAWLAYARGEVCDALGDHAGAVTAYQRAIDIAASVGNPFVMSVGQSSLAHQLARAGRRRQAVETYRACLDGHRRHGNLVHAVTTLRNLAGWLATLGEYREAAIIAAAVSQPVLRPTYGREAEDRANADDSIRRMVGADLADEWAAAGAELDVVTALERADTALRGLLVSD
jgi:tetratricopeptide (TPR) repeat protein